MLGGLKMNKVITLCNAEYFQYGKRFLDTRDRIDANFVCYSPDLTIPQIEELKRHNIKHKIINRRDFDTKMQFLKFKLIKNEISFAHNGYGVTFCDFDTYFEKDWGDIFRDSFALGVTFRKEFIKKGYLRAFANGGVIFAKNSIDSFQMCVEALGVMQNGESVFLPEYDEIWKTLEEGRPAHKTHYRTNLRWWVDQVFLSALVLKGIRDRQIEDLKNTTYSYNTLKVKFFDCEMYNNMYGEGSPYIRHLKNSSGASGKLKDGK